ncbi:hypothetical protein GKE73_14030 [Paludibacterium sp. dN 18-1]|uniref:DUF403 domain-containing protein n=2 Tax=Paludibacterium denitrificans TaxID=2675226 RepID=A0A844GDM3_9NEIS|nr:hypothetical protein [Paludibacterium denitrificans]
MDDDFCDPLELRPDSTLGVPGLLQAVRAGKVLMANALGSSFLESPGLHAFLPAICQHLTGQPLQLASLPSWWCGEPAARDEAVQHLRRRVIKPTYPSLSGYPHFEPVLCPQLSHAELDDWRQQLQGRAEAYTLQENLPLSQAPIWHTGHVEPRAMMLRVFAIANGQGQWNVLPGGLTRIAARPHEQIVSMQRGGSSLDTRILTDGDIDTFSMLPRRLHPAELGGKRRLITSHAAENLFWMGRYAERAENQLRLSQLVLKWLEVNDGNKDPAFIRLLVQLCQQQNLLPETDDAAAPSWRAVS